jgi:hypothetical protein
MPNQKNPQPLSGTNMKITKILAVLSAVAALTSMTAQATTTNLVTNGGFETLTNGLGQIGYNTVATGWTTTGYNFVFGGNTADTTGAVGSYGVTKLWGNNGLTYSPLGGNFLAADGAYQVQAISQSITGLIVGQQYDLSFYWAGAQQSGYSGVTTENWKVSLGDQSYTTATVTDASHGFTGWVQETYSFTATATTEALSFLAAGTPNGEPPFSLLDGVSLTAHAANVPEPSSWALIVTGLAMLCAAVRFGRRGRSA